MTDIYNYNAEIDLEKHIFWQYNNAPIINKLIELKQNWYKSRHSDFWDNWQKNVLSLATANDYGLAIWGNLLKFPRTWVIDGENVSLTTAQYRTLLIATLQNLKTKGTVEEINSLLSFLFSKYGKAYVEDGYDMTITYHFNFVLTKLQLTILRNTPILPRPAGVKVVVLAVDKSKIFGFNGSGCQPFNQAPFASYTNRL